ncbi:DNA-formamidopyrimidine glycosylase [Candidatus Parcubacteria bacterium]|nr:DNA-formamidopyrimidine glycosylase [Candidatus Parcubacteria bacterium]
MPELPEVQTTVDGLNKTVRGRKIVDVWTDYKSAHKMHEQSVKNPAYFKKFKKKVIGAKIKGARRRAKNILIDLSPRPGSGQATETILVHMKMTGHFVYDAKPDYPYIHLAFTLENKKKLVFSDMRKFAKVTLVETDDETESLHLKNLGPEPLEKNFEFAIFKLQILKRPKGKIKQVLLDQSLIAGIGNIYSDEILWLASVHPLSVVEKIPEKNLKLMYQATLKTLSKGLRLGGDSTSDYRNIKGERGKFQATHNAYQRTGEKCRKAKCKGVIKRLVVGARSAHFCPVHQRLFA